MSVWDDSVDLLSRIDSEDLSFAIAAQSDAAEWVGDDDTRVEQVIRESLRIIARERRDGGDSLINDAAWEAISKIARLAVTQAVRELSAEPSEPAANGQ